MTTMKQSIRNMRSILSPRPGARKPRKGSRVDPVASAQRRRYIEHQKALHRACRRPLTDDTMYLLEHGLGDPSRARHCAQRLLSEYTYAQLGYALYMRCRRTLTPPKDPIRAKVVARGKPGVMNAQEKAE